MNRSPEYFQYRKQHPMEPTPALLFGQVVHKLLLEPGGFDSEFAVAPSVDRRTKAGRETWDAFCAGAVDKTVVPFDVYDQACVMTDIALRNPAVEALLEGEHEVPLFWTDPDTDVQCKCRLDAWFRGENGVPVIVDYKTTTDASYRAFLKDVVNYGYYFQAAMYSEGVIQNGMCPRLIKGKPKKRWQKDPETGKRKYYTEIPETIVMGGTEGEILHPRFVFIVQEKAEPYSVNIFEMDMDFISAGFDKFRELIGTYVSCESTGFWYGLTGPFNEPNVLTLPAWLGRGED